MEIASFEPVIGQVYDIESMTTVLKGTFKGFIQNVRSAELYGEKVTVPVGDKDALLLFEVVRRPESMGGYRGYRYAGVHVRTFLDTRQKKIRFTLAAYYFGNTVGQIERGGPQTRRYWKKV